MDSLEAIVKFDNQDEINWKTPSAQESGVSIDRLEGELGSRMYDKESGRNAQYGLTQQVQITDKNWATPQSSDYIEGSRTAIDSNQKCLGRDIKMWLTPKACEVTNDDNFVARTGDRSEGCYCSLSHQATSLDKQWRTPDANDWKNRETCNQLSTCKQVLQVHREENWSTPRASATDSTRPNDKGGIPLSDQVKRLEGDDKNWYTPDCSDRRSMNSKQQGLSNQIKSWATPQAFDACPLVRSEEQLEKTRQEKKAGCANLREQVHAKDNNWCTPVVGGQEGSEGRLRRGFSEGLHGQAGAMKNNLKLNPAWVAQLMGLPFDWGYPGDCRNHTNELRLLGNGVVPQTAEKAFRVLMDKHFKNKEEEKPKEVESEFFKFD